MEIEKNPPETLENGIEPATLDSRGQPGREETKDQAQFVTRGACINCSSTQLHELADGLFDQEPLRGFLAADPWGEDPMPYLAGQRWSYVKCQECGQAFHSRVLSAAWSEIKWSRWISASAIAEFERTTPRKSFDKAVHTTKHVLQLASLIDGQRRLLDFGCGNGEFLSMCRIYGFDSFGVDRSQARRDRSGLRVVPTVDDLQGQFQAITLFEVLEHVDDPRGILQMLRSRLVAGGILVLETPDCTGVRGIESKRDYELIHPLEHINGFTPSTLRSIAERLGFESITKPVSHVTTRALKLAKTEAQHWLRFVLPKTTQQYFRWPG